MYLKTAPQLVKMCSEELLRDHLLEYVGRDVLASNGILGNTFLVASHKIQDVQCTLVDLRATVGNNADNDLLPSVRSPSL